MITINRTHARSNFFQLIKEVVQGHSSTRIASKDGNVILLSEEVYENLLETAELLSIPGMKKSLELSDEEIKQNKVHSFDDVL
jgi:antitoxin YefM